jgi:cytochrome c-type biogenesis protein CcmH/NrfG
MKKYREAIEFLELALQKEPGNAEALGLLQMARRQQKDF